MAGNSLARSSPLRTAALIAAVAVPSGAAADNIDASITGLVQGRQDPRDGEVHTVVPTLALISVRATDIQNPVVDNLSVVMSGWGGFQFGDPLDNRLGAGDLDVAYVEGSELNNRLSLRAGRQLVTGGSAQVLPIDGASLTVRPFDGVGVTAYGGALVVPRFATSVADAAAGARAWYRYNVNTEVGLSFVDVLQNGLVARQELGVDARMTPVRSLTLNGYALLSTLDARLAEADAAATWQPFLPLQITLDYRRTAPDLFISAASIFSVFAEDRHDEVGGSLFYQLTSWATFDADFHGLYTEAGTEPGWGHRVQARIKTYLGPRRELTLGVEGRNLTFPGNGYYEARAFGTWRFFKQAFASIDLDVYQFRAPVNGQYSSYDGTLSIVYNLLPSWQVALSGVAAATPFLERSTQIIARVVYTPSLNVREKKP